MDLFYHFWWLIFPIFGMAMGFYSMVASERRAKNVLDIIRSYTEQGKEPPPELMQLAAQQLKEANEQSSDGKNSSAWSVVVFGAICAGFSVGYYFTRAEEWSWAFLIVAVIMGVLALGGLFIAVFGRK